MHTSKNPLHFGKSVIGHGVVILALVIVIIFTGDTNGDETDTGLIERIDGLLFSTHPTNPEFLSEYRTGNWSWDVTALIYSIETTYDTKRAFIEAIEDSFELASDYHRLTEEEISGDPDKARINRYHLDPYGSDRVRYFTHDFWFHQKKFQQPTGTILAKFELRVIVREQKGGRSHEGIRAYLLLHIF